MSKILVSFFLILSAVAFATDAPSKLKPITELLTAEELEHCRSVYHAELERVFARSCNRKFGESKCSELLNEELGREPWYGNMKANAYIGPEPRELYGFSGSLAKEVTPDGDYEIRKSCRGGIAVIFVDGTPDSVTPHVSCTQSRVRVKPLPPPPVKAPPTTVKPIAPPQPPVVIEPVQPVPER